MTRKEFDSLLHRYPMIAYDMVSVLSKRLNKSENATIRDLRQKNIQLTDAYQELKDAQAQLIEKEKLEHELELARLIQMSILPRNPPDCPGYVFDAFIEPMRAVGGDFYDIIDLGEDRIGVAVGDVSDHGVPAALFMAMTVTLLRAEALRSTSPKEVFSRVNRQLLTTNDTNMFVTALYGVLNCTTREFKYVRAGHELPIVIHQNGELKQIPISNGMPLGLFEDPTFDEGNLTLRDYDTLFLYTDGLTDAIDPGNVHFGKERLHQILRGNSQHIPGGLCQKIFSYVQAYRGEMPQFDDITLLSLQVRP
jgi:sigma-B regulation protein RsbU (phosphoserine phosphatase)